MSRAYSTHTRKRREPTISKIQVPQRCHPLVTLLYAEMKRRVLKLDEVVERSGLTVFTLKAWRHKNNPTLLSAEAALGAINFSLVAVPDERAVPDHIAAELRPIAAKLGIEMADAVRYAALVAVRDHHMGALAAPDQLT